VPNACRYSLQRFRTTTAGCACTPRYKHVESYLWPSAQNRFCERYGLAGVWCSCYVRWCMLFLINCFGIELVLCDLYLTRFALRKDFYGTLSSLFFANCVGVITEYLNSKHFQCQWVGKPNKTLKWNAPQTRFCCGTKCAAGKIFVKKIRCRQNKSKKMSRKQDDWILMGTLSRWCSMYILIHKSQVRIFSL